MVGFNLDLSAVRAYRHTHLHSIMVGFNPKVIVFFHFVKLIYIPLWSDSITITISISVRPYRIYIPLWSDSIQFRHGLEVDGIVFTFHYGRIQSV